MAELKFTDDEWAYDEEDHSVSMNDDMAISICSMQPIDVCDTEREWCHGDETKSNALLITQAPKMYKLLKQYKTITDMHNNEAQSKLIDLQYEVDELFKQLSL